MSVPTDTTTVTDVETQQVLVHVADIRWRVKALPEGGVDLALQYKRILRTTCTDVDGVRSTKDLEVWVDAEVFEEFPEEEGQS